MQKRTGHIIYSPHDLVDYLEGDLASWLDRFRLESKDGGICPLPDKVLGLPIVEIQSDEADESQALIQRKGMEHENRFLTGLRLKHKDLVEIPRDNAFALTLAAMKEGRSMIYQGCLEANDFLGYPDFLARVEGRSALGDWHYEPWDTKLAKSARPSFIVQLCAYAEMLESVQGIRPETFQFVLGDGLEARFRTNDFYWCYLRLKKAFLAFQATFDPTQPPEPGGEASFGNWETVARKALLLSDHVRLVAGISSLQTKRLKTAGISTVSALAKTSKTSVPRIQPDSFTRLKEQATLQLASRGQEKPKFHVIPTPPEDPRRGLALLPPPSTSDVFFDMEGFPLVDGGLEYLFGAVIPNGSKSDFKDWWAHDSAQEKAAFESFVDWAHGRWQKDPTAHIYHYASYEKSALRRLMGRHGTREEQVDDLLRNEVLVDLYEVVRQGVRIGSQGYSLKDIECLFMPPREGGVKTAGDSVAAYQRWLDAGESPEWNKSPALTEIRDYNRLDCESTLGLRNWLLDLQKGKAIAYVPPGTPGERKEVKPKAPEVEAAEILAADLHREADTAKAQSADGARRLAAWILGFHRREQKPAWWKIFDRHAMDETQWIEDPDCLGGLRKTDQPIRAEKQSMAVEYTFPPEQDTAMDEGDKCFFAFGAPGLGPRVEILSMEKERGLVTLKIGSKAAQIPEKGALIPDGIVPIDGPAKAVLRWAQAWRRGDPSTQAIGDLLLRHTPRIEGHPGGPVTDPKRDLVTQLCEIAPRLQGTTLCIQGPPGAGKTYAIGEMIASLAQAGKRVGVTALSHKAILNVLRSAHDAMLRRGVTVPIWKAGTKDKDPLIENETIKVIDNAKLGTCLSSGPVVAGATAWGFARPEVDGKLDVLFVDEAGQFSLGQTVAVGLAARNLVLVGDPMQLSQPVQGAHPGESGRSALDYLLDDSPTIPPEMGVFLEETRRLHPAICTFVSQAVYEGRLRSHPDAAKRKLSPPKPGALIPRAEGIAYIPVFHEGNARYSEEEADAVQKIAAELIGRSWTEADGSTSKLSLNDILFVAPFNMQVRLLEKRLGPGARVGSVDRFQGQEAPVVVISMCASSLEEAPRGAEFLMSPNRLNVAVSRAKCLAIMVASPALMAARCRTLEQMQLVNTYCRLVAYCEKGSGPATP